MYTSRSCARFLEAIEGTHVLAPFLSQAREVNRLVMGKVRRPLHIWPRSLAITHKEVSTKTVSPRTGAGWGREEPLPPPILVDLQLRQDAAFRGSCYS